MRLVHPYSDLTGGEWLRGNLHTHTTQSDGSCDPQTVIDEYARRGYGFLMFSDHEVCTSEDDYRRWNPRGMVLIPGNEIGGGPHLLHVDADRRVPPVTSRQEVLNTIGQIARETERGFAIVNHPNWESQFNHATIEQMREWTGYLGMEIYNGVVGRLDGSSYALDKWDRLLSEGRRIWGFANDDCHQGPREIELGWNVAYVKERSVRGVTDALRAGRFYSSTGVTIRSIHVEGAKVRIETQDAHRIIAICNVGKRFAVADQSILEVTVPATARYARFECWGCGEKAAWTQPFFVEEDRTTPARQSFLEEWRVSSLLEDTPLDKASPAHAEKLHMTPVQCHSARAPIFGLVDVRPQVQSRPGVLYLCSDVPSPAAERGVLQLGYDGPIRVWLNGQEIFHGPGTNPAIVDQLKLYVALRQGVNRLVIALDSNHGKAWGIFGRLELGNLQGS